VENYYIFASVFLVSLISLLGVAGLSLGQDRLKKISLVLVSFAVGALLGDAMLHLLPEAYGEMGSETASLLVIAGIFIFFILEKFLRWRHCHSVECEDHFRPVVVMNLVGDGVHNLIDGMIIAASFMAGVPIGISTTIAVILHEIPQEIADVGVLMHGGLGIKKVIAYNFLFALLAILGAGLVVAVGTAQEAWVAYLLPVTAGGFIYIAGSDLVPELHHETDWRVSLLQCLLMLAGVGVMGGLGSLF